MSGFGSILRDYLEYHKISQTDFADRLGITQKHMNEIINDKTSISLELMMIISLLTDIDVNLIYYVENKKNVYNKLHYMTFSPDKSDILHVLNSDAQVSFQAAESECQLALEDLDEYVHNQDAIFNTPSLKVVLDRFSSAPYGFDDLDIQWLVAKLFVNKNISLSINSEDISIKRDGSQKVLDYLTRGEYREKVLLSVKEAPPGPCIKDAKDILKDLYDYFIATEVPETIMEEFKKN